MDLVAKRFEARYLEVEGKPREALALYQDIIAHFAQEPPEEELLPVYLKATYLTIKLGDRPGGVALLVRGAEHFADHGVVGPVAELCQHLPRLDTSLTRLHLRFARRMLERNHVGPACDLLKDLADRRGKATLRQTLNRMASWPEPIVRGQLLEFLDRADARRQSPATDTAPPTPAAAPAPPPAPQARVEAPPPKPQMTAPDRAAPPPEPPAIPAPPSEEKVPQAPPGVPVVPSAAAPAYPLRSTGPRRFAERASDVPDEYVVLEGPGEDAVPAALTPPPVPEPEPPALPPREGEFATDEASPEPAPPPPPPAPPPAAPPPRMSPTPAPVAVREVVPLVPSLPVPRSPVPAARPLRRSAVGIVLGMLAIAAVAGTVGWFLPRIIDARGRSADPMSAGPVGAPPAAPARGSAPDATPTVTAPDRSSTPPASGADTTASRDTRPPVTVTPPPPTLRAAGPASRDTTTGSATSRPAQAVTALPVVTPPPVTRPSPQPTPTAVDTVRPARSDTARPVVREPDAAPPVPARPAVLQVDYALVMVEGLEVLRVGVEGEGAGRRVVVLQRISPVDTLELREADLGAAAIGLGGGRVLVSQHPSGGAMGTARVGQFLVTARAPTTSPSVLEPLLQRLIELPPQ